MFGKECTAISATSVMTHSSKRPEHDIVGKAPSLFREPGHDVLLPPFLLLGYTALDPSGDPSPRKRSINASSENLTKSCECYSPKDDKEHVFWAFTVQLRRARRRVDGRHAIGGDRVGKQQKRLQELWHHGREIRQGLGERERGRHVAVALHLALGQSRLRARAADGMILQCGFSNSQLDVRDLVTTVCCLSRVQRAGRQRREEKNLVRSGLVRKD